ncbi:MAG: hypothetical protein ACUZ8E_03755 [Candidatus Anammoxibacter sp.]
MDKIFVSISRLLHTPSAYAATPLFSGELNNIQFVTIQRKSNNSFPNSGLGTQVALEAPASTREYGSNNTLIVTCQLEAELLEQAHSQARAWERVAMELNSLNSYFNLRL